MKRRRIIIITKPWNSGTFTPTEILRKWCSGMEFHVHIFIYIHRRFTVAYQNSKKRDRQEKNKTTWTVKRCFSQLVFSNGGKMNLKSCFLFIKLDFKCSTTKKCLLVSLWSNILSSISLGLGVFLYFCGSSNILILFVHSSLFFGILYKYVLVCISMQIVYKVKLFQEMNTPGRSIPP